MDYDCYTFSYDSRMGCILLSCPSTRLYSLYCVSGSRADKFKNESRDINIFISRTADFDIIILTLITSSPRGSDQTDSVAEYWGWSLQHLVSAGPGGSSSGVQASGSRAGSAMVRAGSQAGSARAPSRAAQREGAEADLRYGGLTAPVLTGDSFFLCPLMRIMTSGTIEVMKTATAFAMARRMVSVLVSSTLIPVTTATATSAPNTRDVINTMESDLMMLPLMAMLMVRMRLTHSVMFADKPPRCKKRGQDFTLLY